MALKNRLKMISNEDMDAIHDASKKILAHSGEYIMHSDTLTQCRRPWFPSLSDWGSYEDWEANGAEDVACRAQCKCQEMLAEAPESLLEPDLDAALQAYIEAAV